MAHEQKGTNVTADASLTQQTTDASITQQTTDGSLGALASNLAAWIDANGDPIEDSTGQQIYVRTS